MAGAQKMVKRFDRKMRDPASGFRRLTLRQAVAKLVAFQTWGT